MNKKAATKLIYYITKTTMKTLNTFLFVAVAIIIALESVRIIWTNYL